MPRFPAPLAIATLLLGCLALSAAEPVVRPAPDAELPPPYRVVASGSFATLDLAGFPCRTASAPGAGETPERLVVAAALGALPEDLLQRDQRRHATLDWAYALATTWTMQPPLAAQPLGLLVIGPAIARSHQQCRIERVRYRGTGIAVSLGLWTEAWAGDDRSKSPERPVWLLALPPMSAGPCAVEIELQEHIREAGSGRELPAGYGAAPLLGCTIAATATAAVGDRASASLLLRANQPQPGISGSWLPAAVAWDHQVLDRDLLAGTGLLAIEKLDSAAIADLLANHYELQSPETILASGSDRQPTLLVNGPPLNQGEYASLRVARWSGDHRLDVMMTVWYDDLPREQHRPHQTTWLLPIRLPPIESSRPLHIHLTWESYRLDPERGWYIRQPGRPLRVPVDAESDWPAANAKEAPPRRSTTVLIADPSGAEAGTSATSSRQGCFKPRLSLPPPPAANDF